MSDFGFCGAVDCLSVGGSERGRALALLTLASDMPQLNVAQASSIGGALSFNVSGGQDVSGPGL